MNEIIKYDDPKVIETLKQTVAINATDAEFGMFAAFCKSTGLNPFKKEIWFIKAGGRVQLMTGINGYWQIANSHPQFDGAETGMIDKAGEWVKSVPGADFVGAWCKIYRKDRRIPMEGEAFLSDYRKSSPLWQNSPRIMIKKVAQSIALRQAFPQELNGLYTAEEMPQEFGADATVVVQKAEVTLKREITENPKLEKTREAMKLGTAFQFDGQRYSTRFATDKAAKRAIWNSALKAGALAEGPYIYSAEFVPELAEFLLNDPSVPPTEGEQ